jgi:hypothetical protein
MNQRTAALNRLVEEEEALNKILPDLKQHYDELAPAVTRVFASESDRLKNQIKLAQEDPAKQLEQMNKELEAVAATWDRIGLTMDKHPLGRSWGRRVAPGARSAHRTSSTSSSRRRRKSRRGTAGRGDHPDRRRAPREAVL